MYQLYKQLEPYLPQILKILSGLGLGAFTLFQCSQFDYRRAPGKTIVPGIISREMYGRSSDAGREYYIDLCLTPYPDKCFSIIVDDFPNAKKLQKGDSVEIEFFTDGLNRELAGQSLTEWMFMGGAEITSIRSGSEMYSGERKQNQSNDRIALVAFLCFAGCATLVIAGYMGIIAKLDGKKS